MMAPAIVAIPPSFLPQFGTVGYGLGVDADLCYINLSIVT